MSKILEIFFNDLKKIAKSKMAIVIILGITIIPGIYAWLNIDSNWGPYDNTGNLPLAIVNNDKGTKILGESVNIGNELEESLKENNAMKWIFTDEEDAKSNVEKSKYYGAIIIPEDFSQRVSTIFDGDNIKKPVMDFYVNNKRNPIAPIIVNKAVGTIQNSVNQSFVNTVFYKAASKIDDIDIINKSEQTTEDLVEKLEDAKGRIGQIRTMLKTTNLAADSAGKSVTAIRKLMPNLGNISESTKQGIADMKNAAKSFENTFDSMESDISKILDESEYAIQETIDLADSLDSTNIQSKNTELYNKADKILTLFKRFDSLLKSINDVLDLHVISKLDEKVEEKISKIENVEEFLSDSNEALAHIDEIKDLIHELNDDLVEFRDDYSDEVKDELKGLYRGAADTVNSASNVVLNLNISLDNVDAAMVYLVEALESGAELAENADTVLSNFQDDIDKVIEVVKKTRESEIYTNVVNLLRNNPSEIADFLSAPVETNQIDLYEINTYGAKMTPFYSILACWVGCTVLTAILKIDVKKSKMTKDAKHYQKFFGRFMLFGSLAMIQGLVIGLGDLFLQVQTVNWFLFLITLMLSSLIFMLIIYSLAVALGKIGQALAIVIMVLQVAGSGGTFPIELLPRLFKILQPFMPFYPAMNAARETIGGFYQNDYIKYIFILLCHIIIPLLLGLVVSKYTEETKERIGKELHKTDVIE